MSQIRVFVSTLELSVRKRKKKKENETNVIIESVINLMVDTQFERCSTIIFIMKPKELLLMEIIMKL